MITAPNNNKKGAMISSKDLATLKVRKIIFHDVPTKPKKGGSSAPLLADGESTIDAQRSAILTSRLTRALGSKSAYPVRFSATTGSPVPDAVKDYTAKSHPSKQFVAMSRDLAQFLFTLQAGNVSPGLLCVIDLVGAGRAGLAVLKLERERGAELQLTKSATGVKTFEMSVLDNLVFTDGTRLFKAALFLRASAKVVQAIVCDSQRTIAASKDMAQFWLRFLGCEVLEEPRVATQRWFEATIDFVNDQITDPIVKNNVYEHLMSELNSNRTYVSPKEFWENYLPDEYRKPYESHLEDMSVATSQFNKDVSDIKGHLRRRSFHTVKGVTVTAPADENELVEIAKQTIVVHDQLRSIVEK